MCGISGVHFFNIKNGSMRSWEKELIVDQLLLGIEHRGTDATGIATIRGNGDIWVEKAEVEAREFIKHRTGIDRKAKSILLHTRLATQGHQSDNLNNHPVINGNAVITHNGHIRNDKSIFDSDEKLVRTAEVDSEAIAALFDKHGIQKCNLALQELEGGFAVAAIDQRKPTALVLAKGKSSPLIYYKNEKFIIWASELKVIEEAMEKVFPKLKISFSDVEFMHEGEILYIDNGKAEELNFKVKETVYKKSYANGPYGVGLTPIRPKTSMHNSSWRGWEDDESENVYVPKAIVPRYGPYEIIVDGREITYRCCFSCGIAANEEFLRPYDGGWWCDICMDKELEWSSTKNEIEKTAEIVAEDKILVAFEQQVDKDHEDICEKIAKEFGLTKNFVDFMLFECEELLDGEIKNELILDLYNQISLVYDIEVGAIVGDEVEKEESEQMKMELVKYSGKKKQFLGL